jgi:starch phosphorylase
MKRLRQLVRGNGTIYSTQVPMTRPVTDYTARVVPHCDGVAIPLEEARILWQR